MEAGQSGVLRDKLGLWETKLAPLSDSQREAFTALSAAVSVKPGKAETAQEEFLATKGEAPTTITTDDAIGPEMAALENVVKQLGLDSWEVENTQQFFSWLSEVEKHINNTEESQYKTYCSQLAEYRTQCDAILNEVTTAIDQLQQMKEKYNYVSSKTDAMNQACEKLLEDQSKLTNVAESITTKLSYFNELDKIGQKLNLPALSVTSDSFVPMLARLDECIAFIQNKLHYKESQLYLARFMQFQARALNFIKLHVVSSLKNTTKSIQASKPGTTTPPEHTYSNYYGKFRTNASRIKILMKEIEQRLDKYPDAQVLLRDCQKCYISQRRQLLLPIIATSNEAFQKQHGTDTCNLVRSSCNYLCRLCQSEHQLYYHFFTLPSSELNGLLESLCFSLYDVLRPIIIKINHLETLAELCSILNTEMIEEQVKPKEEEMTSFGLIMTQMLQDVQQRLVYRAQKFIESDIRGYSPAAGDLAYPEKLILTEDIEVLEDPQSEHDSVFEGDATKQIHHKKIAVVDIHAMWYPTVRRSILCMSKLYRCIEKYIFEGIAQEAVSQCILSLQSAAQTIERNKTRLDGELFLIKHLLILREEMGAFKVEFSITEFGLDFSRTRNAAYELLRKRSKMFSLGSNNSFLEFFLQGTPELTESHIDSRKEVDGQLKKTCELFISHVSSELIAPIKDFLSKVEVVLEVAVKSGTAANVLIKQQPFAEPAKVHEVVTTTNRMIKEKLPSILRSMSLYLANDETEHILFRPIKANVIQNFSAFEKFVTKNYSVEDQQIVAFLTTEQVSLMLIK
ncbi:conserved oligomeric Golgi complex subunit 3-like [Dysidea avara]|uniref:conserved oligomeric Golgi complex subunit 3-like n=1 Tax=Dysidea avara TaxID=196820 RepID=UPI00333018F1